MDSEHQRSLTMSFDKERHVMFLQMMNQLLPSNYQSQDINLLTLAYFVIAGLDLLGELDYVDKHAVADWVLSFQGQFYGFHGSRCSQFPSDDNGVSVHNCSHLASTYSALAILKVIGYDFSEIDSETMTSMKNLQQPDGSPFLTNLLLCGFMPIHIGAGTDLRFVYCAASICSLLKNWSGMEKEKARNYILNCKGCLSTVVSVILWWFWFNPWIRVSCGTGGATYCAVASLRLMGFIEDDLLSKNRTSSILDVPLLLDWSLQRQFIEGGFQGRPNKPSDTCYAFWIRAVLRILGGHKFIDDKSLRDVLFTCQSEYGGFSKFPRGLPDLYHSFYGFTAFSLLEEPGPNSCFVELEISDIAAIGLL